VTRFVDCRGRNDVTFIDALCLYFLSYHNALSRLGIDLVSLLGVYGGGATRKSLGRSKANAWSLQCRSPELSLWILNFRSELPSTREQCMSDDRLSALSLLHSGAESQDAGLDIQRSTLP